MFNLIPNDSICVDNYEDAVKLMKILTDNNYVPMLTKEDFGHYIISYIWEPDCDRNGIVFVSREEWDEAEMTGEIKIAYDDDVVILDELKEDDEWTKEEYAALERRLEELVAP